MSYRWADEFAEDLLHYASDHARDFLDLLMQWRIAEPEQWEDFKRNDLAAQIEDIRQPVWEWTPNLSVYLPSDFVMTEFEKQYGDAGMRGIVHHMKELLAHCISLSPFTPNSYIVSMAGVEYETGYNDIDGCRLVYHETAEWYALYTINGILMTPELSEDVTTGRLTGISHHQTQLTTEYVTQTFANAIREWGGRLDNTQQLRRGTVFTVDPPNREHFDEFELPDDHPYNEDSDEDDDRRPINYDDYEEAREELWREKYLFIQDSLRVFLRQYYGSDEKFDIGFDEEGFIQVTFDEDRVN